MPGRARRRRRARRRSRPRTSAVVRQPARARRPHRQARAGLRRRTGRVHAHEPRAPHPIRMMPVPGRRGVLPRMAENDQRPVVVAYDGSPEAAAAVRAAARLFGDRPLVVVSVWEPGLAVAMAPLRDPTGIGYGGPLPEEMLAVDQAQEERAVAAAESGARIARQLGAPAEACPIADEVNVADRLATIAEERDASAVVVGSRGLGKVKSGLFGSTSRRLLGRTERPVLVVKAAEEP